MSCRPLDGICHSISESHEIDEEGNEGVRSFGFEETSVGGVCGKKKGGKRDASAALILDVPRPTLWPFRLSTFLFAVCVSRALMSRVLDGPRNRICSALSR